jgi:hypothetical protein
MDALIFVGKSFLVTIALVLIMQVKVGDERLEYKVADVIRGSTITHSIQGIADSAVKLIRNTWNKVSGSLGTGFSNAITFGNRPGERGEEVVNWKRSKEYIKNKASTAKNSVEDHLREEGIIEKKDQPTRKFVE